VRWRLLSPPYFPPLIPWAFSLISDFGPIFAELLPGNFAKLQAPEGQDITQGLEVKVRLGTVWKASLTELSGGQR
jgi:chromosome segregation ATPase